MEARSNARNERVGIKHRYKLTAKGRAAGRRYHHSRARRCPEKVRAWRLVATAIRSGRLVRQPCEICGARRVEAHHPDYRKPLAVEWLCYRHHRAAEAA